MIKSLIGTFVPADVVIDWPVFYVAANMDVLTRVSVEYKTLPGWCCSTEAARSYEELPPQAQSYIQFIEDFLQVPGLSGGSLF